MTVVYRATEAAPTQELTTSAQRIGLSHEKGLELRAGSVEHWIRHAVRSALAPDSYAYRDNPRALYERGEIIKKLSLAFDSFVREFSRIQGFEDAFEQPIVDAAWGVAERMEKAGFEIERAQR